MAWWFEISVNGQRRFIGEDVRVITLAVDWLARQRRERASVLVGMGEPEERDVQYLGGDLGPGDEIVVRVLADDEERPDANGQPESCSFCKSSARQIQSLVAAGPSVAICETCILTFRAAVVQSGPLPAGASIQDEGNVRCGFCLKAPPEVVGLLVRNSAAVCPECLSVCMDLLTSR